MFDPIELLWWGPLILLWCAWVMQALLVGIIARKFSRRIGWDIRDYYEQFHPTAAVIVPFKGVDADLPRNVRGLLKQDYPQYRLIFVLESEDDPALRVLQEELALHTDPPRIDYLFAGQAPDDTGQKVHNQLQALAFLEENAPEVEIWVFADSDAVPDTRWLQTLIGPHVLPDKVAATTGYRWLVPQLRAQRAKLGSVFASLINAGVATMVTHAKLTQAWGGSMAVRADFAREHDLVGHLRGSLSDDYQLTRMCRSTPQRLYFVFKCLVASPIDMTLRELFEFARRQYTISRVHDPNTFYKAVGLVLLYVSANLSAIAAAIFSLMTGRWIIFVLAMNALIWVGIFNQFRATYRRRIVRTAFGPDMVRYMKHTLWFDRFGTLAVMTVNLILLLSSSFGKTIRWRGNTYLMNGPQQVKKLN